MTTKLEEKLYQIATEANQAAREIFYAELHIKNIRDMEMKGFEPLEYVKEVDKRLQWTLSNLEAALTQLGVSSPEQVGLSSAALRRK